MEEGSEMVGGAVAGGVYGIAVGIGSTDAQGPSRAGV